MGVIIIHCMTPWRYVEFMVVPDGRMTLCRPRRRHAGDGLERMRVRYWKANRSVARVQEVVEVRANGPLERTAHRRSRAAGAAPPPARRRGRPRPGGQFGRRGRGARRGAARVGRRRSLYVLTARASPGARPRPAAPARPREPVASGVADPGRSNDRSRIRRRKRSPGPSNGKRFLSILNTRGLGHRRRRTLCPDCAALYM